MIDAGLPLVQCLEILSSQGDNPGFNEIIRDVKAHVEGGSTFADSLKRHPKVFDELFVNLIHAGDAARTPWPEKPPMNSDGHASSKRPRYDRPARRDLPGAAMVNSP